MTYPLVRDLAGYGYPVAVTCRVLKFSAQGYYKWLKKPVRDRDLTHAYLTNAAIDAHGEDPEFASQCTGCSRRTPSGPPSDGRGPGTPGPGTVPRW